MSEALVKLGLDVAHNSIGNFSKEEAEQTLRAELTELLGKEKNIRRALRKNGPEIFTVMEDVLDVMITEGIENQFNEFVDYRNVNHGDRPVFMVEDFHLFKVATIAAGTQGIRRQRLDRTPFTVPTAYKGVKIYDELERFLAGKVDFAKMIAKVQKSFNAQIGADINTAIVAAYSALSSPYSVTGSFDITIFNTLVQHVEAATDVKAMVAGTKLALQKVAPAFVAYNGQLIEQRNQDGYFKVVDGTLLHEIRQSHVPGSDTFAVATNFLLVLPTGEEKIVKLVLEGEPEIKEVSSGNESNGDDSVEYMFKKKYGVGVVSATKYGVMTLS